MDSTGVLIGLKSLLSHPSILFVLTSKWRVALTGRFQSWCAHTDQSFSLYALLQHLAHVAYMSVWMWSTLWYEKLAEECASPALTSSTLKLPVNQQKTTQPSKLVMVMVLWLQCYDGAILSHVLLTARYVAGVPVVTWQHHAAQGHSDATGQWDALWEGSNHTGTVQLDVRWIIDEVGIAVSHPLGIKWCQAVVLQDEVAIVIILAVALCNAAARISTEKGIQTFSVTVVKTK